LGVHELPDRTVVDLQAALAQFIDKAAQNEVFLAAALDKPIPPSARYLLRLVAADPARLHPPVCSNNFSHSIAAL
jgi:hypothetical protein